MLHMLINIIGGRNFFSRKIGVILGLLVLTIKIFADIICPVCGETNPDGTKFCGFCGAPIETLKPQTKIDLPKELMEYSRKPEVMLQRRNRTSLILGLVGVVLGAGMSIYGFTKEDITKKDVIHSEKLTSLANVIVDGYYYPKGTFEITNNGNTVAKNFLVRVKFYDNTNKLIKTEYINLPIDIKPEKSVSQTIETDTGKNSVATTEVEIVDYQIENIYKIKDENLAWGGIIVFGFGLYNLIKYYNQTVSSERHITYFNNKNFSLFITHNGLLARFRFKIS
ncbi:MAG: zinc ribbon domain-containing protein [Endomicrobiia bacterium]